MSWFSGVPLELSIAGTRFRLAAEALDEQERSRDALTTCSVWTGNARKRTGPATSLFLLARQQLDQMVLILEEQFELPVSVLSGSEVARRLSRTVEELELTEKDEVAHSAHCIGEGVGLWRALQDVADRPVGHAFAVDGSISFTHGPDLPELPALGLRACPGGELEVTPLEVFEGASSCTRDAAWLAVVIKDEARRLARRAALAEAARAKHDLERDLRVLRGQASDHLSVWWQGSEAAFTSWAFDLLEGAGLAAATDALAAARTSARLMSLWALNLEFAAHSGEGAPGDWRDEIGQWVNAGMSVEQLHLLNQAEELGRDLEGEEFEVPLSEVCVRVVGHYCREVSDAILKDLGDSYAFAYFWANRLDDVTYPLSPELVGEICNDESVLADDPQSKLPAFNWVQSGMNL